MSVEAIDREINKLGNGFLEDKNGDSEKVILDRVIAAHGSQWGPVESAKVYFYLDTIEKAAQARAAHRPLTTVQASVPQALEPATLQYIEAWKAANPRPTGLELQATNTFMAQFGFWHAMGHAAVGAGAVIGSMALVGVVTGCWAGPVGWIVGAGVGASIGLGYYGIKTGLSAYHAFMGHPDMDPADLE